MRSADVVFHLASKVDDWGSPADYWRDNVVGTRQVLVAAQRAGVRRLVYISTEAVLLGGRSLVQVDETWPLPRRPIGLYARSKGIAEQAVLAANGSSLTTIVVRPRFIWGRGDTTVLQQMATSVKKGQWAWIAGGHYLTSSTHVLNACEGLCLAAEKGRGGEIYFVTDGAPVEFRGFVTALLDTQGLNPGTREIPRPVARAVAAVGELVWRTFHLAGTPPLTRSLVRVIGEEVTINDAKARHALGYRGHISREAGLQAMRQP